MNEFEKYLRVATAITEVGKNLLNTIESKTTDIQYYKDRATEDANCDYFAKQAEMLEEEIVIWKELVNYIRDRYVMPF